MLDGKAGSVMAFLDEEWDVRWDDDAPGVHSFFQTCGRSAQRTAGSCFGFHRALGRLK